MKRNLDLVREILLAVEGFEPTTLGAIQRLSPKDFSGSEPQNLYHIRMLIDAGLLKPAGNPLMSGEYPVGGMTMEGHDFLDAIKEQAVWDKTKTRVGDVGAWTLDIVLAVAKDEIKRRLGLALGGF